MSAARCTDTPISWLRLERYHLGEVDGAERVRIEAHLAACAACAEAYAALERDDAVALSPLPAVSRDSRDGRDSRDKDRRHRSPARLGAMAAGGAALAAAAAVIFGIGSGWRRGGTAPLGANGTGDGVKGNAVVFSLVREDSARVDEAAGVFRDGDRFKAVVTCPPPLEATFDLVVYDESGASFPVAPARVRCGNEVPVPGAFRLSGGGEETVCLVWELGREPDRSALAEGGAPAPGGEKALCKRLKAVTTK